MVTNETIKIANTPIECNACLCFEECLEDIVSDLTFAEKRAIITARNHNWSIQPGEQYRSYQWTDDDCYFENDKPSTEPLRECCEIPAMAAICTRLNLWP